MQRRRYARKKENRFTRLIMIVSIGILSMFIMDLASSQTPTQQNEIELLEIEPTQAFIKRSLEQLNDQYSLLLVNSHYPNTVDEEAIRLLPANKHIPLAAGDTMLEEKTLLHAKLFFQAASEAGISNLFINSGYRSRHQQDQLYAAASDKNYVAKPGQSEHELGFAMDLQLVRGGFDSKEGEWIRTHAAQYGFILRYPQGKSEITGVPHEPWHFRYVGQPHATYITAKSLSLEEYIERLQPGKYYQVRANGKTYLLYRVKAEQNRIEVPTEGAYQVSSDGTGYYIVTIHCDDL
ncbi:MAG: M15 family metallopeptidase [Firmicutes bacterium]|nr:M15 family metallopeptidase [Bacillota bacterium]